MGLWFTWLIATAFVGSVRTYTWPATRCVIETSGVEEHPGAADAGEAYLFRVRYHYQVAGRPYVGVRFRPGYSGSADVGAAERLAERYAPGSETVCYANPNRPDAAMLERPSLWSGFLVLLPLIFVAAGAGGIVSAWWPRRPQPISGRAGKNWSDGGCLIGFFALFLFAGLGVFIPFFALPAWRTVEARSWVATPCTILHSEVRAHPGDDSTTYSVDVLYAYRVGGREVKSSRYNFSAGSTSGLEAKQKVIARYPEGSAAICYVDPADPTRAVLERGLSRDLWIGLLPLIFVAVGAGGIAFAIRSLPKRALDRGGANRSEAG